MAPYWHVPKLASMTVVTCEADGTVSLTCRVCGEKVQTWSAHPTLTDLIEAAKGHKHTRS